MVRFITCDQICSISILITIEDSLCEHLMILTFVTIFMRSVMNNKKYFHWRDFVDSMKHDFTLQIKRFCCFWFFCRPAFLSKFGWYLTLKWTAIAMAIFMLVKS